MIDLRLMGGMAGEENRVLTISTSSSLSLATSNQPGAGSINSITTTRKIAPSRAKSSTVVASDEVHRTLNKWVAKIPC